MYQGGSPALAPKVKTAEPPRERAVSRSSECTSQLEKESSAAAKKPSSLRPFRQSENAGTCAVTVRLRRLRRTGFRTILRERQMGPRSVIISTISQNVLLQTALVEDDHVIQALPSNAADQALDVRSLPRGT